MQRLPWIPDNDLIRLGHSPLFAVLPERTWAFESLP
jgi:hypothetical protein